MEEEILWAHLGFNSDGVSHLRLGLLPGEIFTENPEINRDVLPVLNLFKKFRPTIITVALDPKEAGLTLIIKFSRLFPKRCAFMEMKRIFLNYVSGDTGMCGTVFILPRQIFMYLLV